VLPELRVKGILYCPDFVINSGGVISVGAEYNNGGWDQKWVTEKVDNIFNTLNSVLDKAEQSGKHAEDVAIELAKERIAKAGGTR
jgi:glutamate dehydrogenase/leucine dehydrogenase